jgi:hypothetical protein
MDQSETPAFVAAVVGQVEGPAVEVVGLEEVVRCTGFDLGAVVRLVDLQDEGGTHWEVLQDAVAAEARSFRTGTAGEEVVVADLAQDRLHPSMAASAVQRMDFLVAVVVVVVVAAAEVHLGGAEVVVGQVHI